MKVVFHHTEMGKNHPIWGGLYLFSFYNSPYSHHPGSERVPLLAVGNTIWKILLGAGGFLLGLQWESIPNWVDRYKMVVNAPLDRNLGIWKRISDIPTLELGFS